MSALIDVKQDLDSAAEEAPKGRLGHYMHTSNGKKYWPTDPHAEEVHIEVIAHHLATKCRYAGAVQHPEDKDRIFYSVAEHSVLVALYLALQGYSDHVVLAGLLHDGSEAYNGDLIRPLKYDYLFAEPFKRVEERNERVIAERFNLRYPFHFAVKVADEAVTTAEVRQIVPRDPNEEWESGRLHEDELVAPFQIAMWLPAVAKERFLKLYRRIANGETPRTIDAVTWHL